MRPLAVGFIFARGGSKAAPRKNVCDLAAKPLIAWSIEAALASRYVRRVVVPTDDAEIAMVARQWVGGGPFLAVAGVGQRPGLGTASLKARPANPGQSSRLSSARGFSERVPPCAPQGLDCWVERLLAGTFDLCLTVTSAARSLYFNQATMDQVGRARPWSRRPRIRRRSWPRCKPPGDGL